MLGLQLDNLSLDKLSTVLPRSYRAHDSKWAPAAEKFVFIPLKIHCSEWSLNRIVFWPSLGACLSPPAEAVAGGKETLGLRAIQFASHIC